MGLIINEKTKWDIRWRKIQNCTSDAVRETYSDSVDSIQIFELKTHLRGIKQGEIEVTSYYIEILNFR